VIYFALAEGSGAVKIGYTGGDPRGRLASLATGCPQDLILLATEPGGLAEEAALHARFGDTRIRGEWFSLDESLAAYLAWLVINGVRGRDPCSFEPYPRAILSPLGVIQDELIRPVDHFVPEFGQPLWRIEGEGAIGESGGGEMCWYAVGPEMAELPDLAKLRERIGPRYGLHLIERVTREDILPVFLQPVQVAELLDRLNGFRGC
jgi:hypothetical protein